MTVDSSESQNHTDNSISNLRDSQGSVMTEKGDSSKPPKEMPGNNSSLTSSNGTLPISPISDMSRISSNQNSSAKSTVKFPTYGSLSNNSSMKSAAKTK